MKRLRLIGYKHETLDHFPSPVSIVGASTGVHIQEATRNVRVENLIGIFILNLVQTTQCAAVTKRLPLFACHLGERFAFPKWFRHRPVLCDTRDRIST